MFFPQTKNFVANGHTSPAGAQGSAPANPPEKRYYAPPPPARNGEALLSA